MKEILQRCLALVLAFCVASPACCCAFSCETTVSEVSSCCGGGGSDLPDEHTCGCDKMEAVADWKVKETIPCNLFQLPAFAGYETQWFNLLPTVVKVDSTRDSWVEVLPSVRRQALLQRFLI